MLLCRYCPFPKGDSVLQRNCLLFRQRRNASSGTIKLPGRIRLQARERSKICEVVFLQVGKADDRECGKQRWPRENGPICDGFPDL